MTELTDSPVGWLDAAANAGTPKEAIGRQLCFETLGETDDLVPRLGGRGKRGGPGDGLDSRTGGPGPCVKVVGMTCPSCGRRNAQRACPALGHDICTVCCATKRVVEIRCPDTCRYLVSAQRHPPAAVVRQRESDYVQLMELTRDYSDRQAAVFVLINQTLLAIPSSGLDRLVDADVAEAAGALAATLETAAKGVIYEQRPASRPAARIADALRPVLTRAGEGGGTAFERDTAVVLRGIEGLARSLEEDASGYLALVRRTIGAVPRDADRPEPADAPRLILP